jgi:very-short-patch-repair endonuclease
MTRRLRKLGFGVLRFWEHDLEEKLPACLRRIAAETRSIR